MTDDKTKVVFAPSDQVEDLEHLEDLFPFISLWS